MKIDKTHEHLLKLGPFNLSCTNRFTPEDNVALQIYGRVMEALTSGQISPLTPDEARLIKIHLNKVKPKTIWEMAWYKLKERRRFEADKTPHYQVFPIGEDWFSRSAIGRVHLVQDFLPTTATAPRRSSSHAKKRRKACPICGDLRTNLEAHIRKEHGTTPKEEGDLPAMDAKLEDGWVQKRCGQCGNKYIGQVAFKGESLCLDCGWRRVSKRARR